jgi:hypothetical protein
MTITQWKLPTITGNGTTSSEKPLSGKVEAIRLEYAVTPNAATDVTIATANDPAKTILTVINAVTNAWFYPRVIIQDDTGVNVTYDGTNEVYDMIPVSDYIIATVAQGDVDQTLDVWVLLS